MGSLWLIFKKSDTLISHINTHFATFYRAPSTSEGEEVQRQFKMNYRPRVLTLKITALLINLGTQFEKCCSAFLMKLVKCC